MAFTLPALPYTPDALEPHIDKQTMEIHHGKHHQAYVDNLNKAIAGTEHENKSLAELVASAGKISPAVRNNGGGHWNHSFFWELLSANGEKPSGKLAEAINSTFGSLEVLREKAATEPCIGEILSDINILIDGAYIESLSTGAGLWTGSGNQRVIDLAATRKSGRIILYQG